MKNAKQKGKPSEKQAVVDFYDRLWHAIFDDSQESADFLAKEHSKGRFTPNNIESIDQSTISVRVALKK